MNIESVAGPAAVPTNRQLASGQGHSVAGASPTPLPLEAKREEWDEYRKVVTRWEIDRYLEVY